MLSAKACPRGTHLLSGSDFKSRCITNAENTRLLKVKQKEFNKKYFTKKLVPKYGYGWQPLRDIPIVVKKLPGLRAGEHHSVGDKIVINSQNGWDDQVDTLLHEMIHQANYEWALDLAEPMHGTQFTKLRQKIAKQRYPITEPQIPSF